MKQDILLENYEYVKKHKEKLLKDYRNKYILVYNKKVIESFDSYEIAAKEGVDLFGLEAEFLVYHVLDVEPINFIMAALI